MSDNLRDDLADVIREHWDAFSVITLADALMPRIEQAIAEATDQALERAAQAIEAEWHAIPSTARYAARIVRDAAGRAQDHLPFKGLR